MWSGDDRYKNNLAWVTLSQATRSVEYATITLAPQHQRLMELSMLPALVQRGPTGLLSPRLRLGDRARILSFVLPVASLLAGALKVQGPPGPVPYGYDWSPLASLRSATAPRILEGYY